VDAARPGKTDGSLKNSAAAIGAKQIRKAVAAKIMLYQLTQLPRRFLRLLRIRSRV